MTKIVADINLDRSSGQDEARKAQFDYEIVRSSRKTIVIHVTHRSVEVRAPLKASRQYIEQFVNNNSAWITKKLEEKSRHHTEALKIENGSSIFIAGREKTIVFHHGNTECITVSNGDFIISGNHLSKAAAAKIFHRHMLDRARNYLPQRSFALAQHLSVGHKLREVVFRKTKTKWGHCTSTGRIQYNWLIMMAPNAIIDYIVVHEVCHLIHMNHCANYWQLVESIIGDYKYYIRWLKKHEHRFWF